MLRGRDVFSEGEALRDVLGETLIRHWAPNCSTFSRARERPIVGAFSSPKPLRDDANPRGIPSVLAELPPVKRRRLDLDTCMADMAAEDCIESHRAGRYFSLEHPKNSIARRLDSWQELEGLQGVFSTEYHACMFKDCRRRKSQVLIHNIPGLVSYIGRLCSNSKICSRTGVSHLSWKPSVINGRVTSFPTGEEREYPQGFCAAYALGIGTLQEEDQSFLEVFSGANAPLSQAVAGMWGLQPIRTAAPLLIGGEKFEFSESGMQHATAAVPREPYLRKKESSDSPGVSKAFPEKEPYRKAAVEAGKQPSYGKRLQLIPDGLSSPLDHLEAAKQLQHPFDSLATHKADHAKAVALFSSSPQELVARRFEALERLRTWERELRSQQVRENKRASWTAQKLGLKPNTVLMTRLQDLLDIEDKEVPQACLKGLGITGKAAESPFFDDFPVPPSMSKEKFHAGKHERSVDMIARVKFMAQKGPPELAKAIWEKTLKEVAGGTMGPPMTLDQVIGKYKTDFQVTPSFGLAQGLDNQGKQKFRRIDDHTASGVNPSAHRLQKVPMAMVDYVGVMVRAVAAVCTNIQFATEDMKGAYRQIPLAPADVRYAITAVYNPESHEVVLFEMYGQPFGAGHAVPNFCRVSEWLSRVLQRYFYLHVDHFFDDFFLVEPSLTIQAGIFVMKESFKLLGFSLDPEKSQTPAAICAILGVVFSTAALASERRINVSAKPSRIVNLIHTIDSILSSGDLSPAVAASIVGKFGFLCSTLFGKVGRCCTAALRHRQCSSAYQRAITPEIRLSLQLMKQFLRNCPDRELKLSHESPLLMYTDASDVPGRSPQRLLGAVLFDPVDRSLVFSSWAVSDATVSQWLQKESYMGQLELLAAPFAFSTWQDRVKNRSIILFMDNDSAAASLVKGYSPKIDSGAIVGEFWLLVAQLRAHVYIDRVESKSNIADGPSRNQFDEVKSLGGLWTSPRTGTFGEPSRSLPTWFGTPSQRGGENLT